MQNGQTTRKTSPDFECISQFSKRSKNVKIVPLVPHFPNENFKGAYPYSPALNMMFEAAHS